MGGSALTTWTVTSCFEKRTVFPLIMTPFLDFNNLVYPANLYFSDSQ
jgi:hypothetical protein